jgi:hypothetical protein
MTMDEVELPEAIRRAFEGRPYLPFRDLAKALEMDVKTLRAQQSGHGRRWQP